MRIEIRTSADEKRRWQEIAESKGVSLSDLVRSLLAGQRLRKRRDPPRVDPALLRELARLGNNLNQLARHANSRRGDADAARLAAAVAECRADLRRIFAAPARPEAR